MQPDLILPVVSQGLVDVNETTSEKSILCWQAIEELSADLSLFNPELGYSFAGKE